MIDINKAKIEAFGIPEVSQFKDNFYLNRIENSKSVSEIISLVTLILIYVNMNKGLNG